MIQTMKTKLFQIAILNITCLLFLSIPLIGQEKDKQKSISNGLYIHPTQLFFPEIILTFEHFVKPKLSFSYSLGYKIPTGKGNTLSPIGHGLFAAYEYQYLFNKFSNAVYLSFAPSFYIDKHRKYYLQPELFYRFYWFDNKKLAFDGERYNYNSIRSERNHVIGFKLLAGVNKSIHISEKKAINIKLYGGLGIRNKYYNYKNIDNIVNNYDGTSTTIPFEVEKGQCLLPSFHLGFKIGVSGTIENQTENK